jgi:outer membrane cobalamin receptor
MKQVLLVIFVCLLSTPVFSQPQDSSYVSEADSLKGQPLVDTIPVEPSRTFVQGGSIAKEILSYFYMGDDIKYRDMDNSTGESFGDLMRMRSLFDVASLGPSSQPENLYLAGDGRGVNIFVDGIPYKQQDLYFPQRGEMDLNTISLSNISEIEILPVSLAGNDMGQTGATGINITTKDFDNVEPYSRLLDDRGPYGFRRTVVELGRGFTSRGKFYVTTELNKSDGYLINSGNDGISVSGKTTFRLKKDLDLKLSGYQYRTTMGLPLFPQSRFQDVKKKVNNWRFDVSLLRQEKETAVSNLDFRFDKQNQEIKSRSYDFESKKIDEVLGLDFTQTASFYNRHYFKLEGCLERRNFKALKTKRAINSAYFSLRDQIKINPKLNLIFTSQIEKEEELETGFSLSGGAAYQLSDAVKLFSTGGRFVGNPTLMDLFWLPFSAEFKDTIMDYLEEGNANLKQQKSYSADLGLGIQKGDYKVNAYAFVSKIDDYIFWSNVDTLLYYGHFKPINSQAKIWGADLDLSGKFLDYFTSYFSYTFKHGENSERKTRLPYSPDHNFFGYIQFNHEYLKREIGIILRLEANAFSERFMDEYEKDKEPAAAILNGKVTIRFLDFHFYYIVRNVTNQNYRLSGAYSMPERTFWWGFYWEFFD